MTEKPKIGADGELDDNVLFTDEKLKRSDSIWRRMRYGPVIPLLVLTQTLLLGLICGGGVLLITGVLSIDKVRCTFAGTCSTPSVLATAIAYGPLTAVPVNTVVEIANLPCDSPRTGEIAFISEQFFSFGAVYLMAPDGNAECRFLQAGDGVYSIAWSPDGQSMAYVTSQGLRLIDRVGNNQTALYEAALDHDQIDWSPDGQQIVFAAHPTDKNNGSTEIMVLKVGDRTVRVLTDSPAQDYSPAWSPDGKQIAFVSARDGSSKIYLMNADGSNQRRLTSDSGVELSPAWSPDGGQIVFSASYDSTYQIYIRGLQTGTIQRLTTGGVRNSAPRWSPDGKQITFVSYRDGNDELYVMDVDGGNIHRLTNNLSEDYSPVWIR